ncbi:MAG: hypothetical protein COA67_08880 [Lutibacter sp.]|nr:MAG: hypothetical protein COA67_08880 [Lutibacter sp.]
MRKLIYISTFLTLTLFKVNAQDNHSFFKEIDTLFITYDSTMLDENIVEIYSNRQNELKTTYNLLNNTEKNTRNRYIKYRDSMLNLGKLIGASSNCHRCVGQYFINKPNKKSFNFKIKESNAYKVFKTRFLGKKSVTRKDSLEFEKFLFNHFNERVYTPNSLMLDKKELNKKNIIHFDGSVEASNKLMELVKQPVYIYLLEKKIVKEEYESSVKNKFKLFKKEKNYYIFNRVLWVSGTRLYFDEKYNE